MSPSDVTGAAMLFRDLTLMPHDSGRIRDFVILFLVATGVLCLAPAGITASAQEAPRRPNIVFILADDIGYGDLGCYGGKHAKTPQLDKLAAAGCRFLDAHSPAAVCTPSRRAFLTGVYSWRQPSGSGILPGDAPLSIPEGTVTVASLLKQAGYRTGVVGKWHVGLGPQGGPEWNHEIKPGPLELGFDSSFIMAATGDRVPTVYLDNHRVVGLDPGDPIRVSYGPPIGNDPTGKEHPELLKLKHTHGHDGTIVNGVGRIGTMSGGHAARWKDEDMSDTFTRQAVSFIEKNQGGPFFLFFATHNIHVPRVPHPRFQGTSPVGTRGDAIHELDDAVGQVLAALDRLKLMENTLVIFSSDNGGVMDDGYEDVGNFDYHPNAPLKGGKGTIWEGGHRVPFIARWPGKIPAGIQSSSLLTLLDMPATFAAIAGVEVPTSAFRDSLNVQTALQGISPTGRETLVTHVAGVQGQQALRQGPWKYIPAGPGSNYGKKGAPADKPIPAPGPHLYNLAEDLGETQNLAEKHPEKVKEMAALLEKIRTQPETVTSAVEQEEEASWTFTPDPKLPNVLILGDSISIGYTREVRKLLAGKANVYRPMGPNGKRPANCSGTTAGVKQIDQWLKGTKWDVIHFNWGLHDMKHVKEPGADATSNSPDSPVQATVEKYVENLDAIVGKLKATQARLIFATTTPVVPGTTNPLREPDAPATYNAAALKIMQANSITVNDLFGYCQPHLEEWQLPKNVHFKPVGSAALARKVAAEIEKTLGSTAKENSP